MKTKQELMQAYWGPGGTVDIVRAYNSKHGCYVKPYECVKDTITGEVYFYDPVFVSSPDKYTFALTILYDDKRKEHRPVFVGDKLWWSSTSSYQAAEDIETFKQARPPFWSWNPPTPKRTFKLNDLELPCPDKNKGGYQIALISSKHFFSDFHDAQKVANAIDEILTAARDKE